MRQTLPKDKSDEIRASLPDLDTRWFLATTSSPALDKYDLDNATTRHISLVCLADAFSRMRFALDSLFESQACAIYYREVAEMDDETKEFFAIRNSKYYIDYTMLFLYAIGEDIADFIFNFLPINSEYSAWLKDEKTQRLLGSKGVSSKAAKVGIFMRDKHPTNQISIIISALKDSPEWNKAMSYRNTWVHDKPPIIEGLGIEYDRKSRISEKVVDGVRTRQIGFGGGSEAKYKIDEIDAIATNATTVCVSALNNLLQIVIDERTKVGESFDFENGKISSNL